MTQETPVTKLDGYTDPAIVAAAGRLGLAAALLSGLGLALLAVGALAGS
jgi:hypothetical protein